MPARNFPKLWMAIVGHLGFEEAIVMREVSTMFLRLVDEELLARTSIYHLCSGNSPFDWDWNFNMLRHRLQKDPPYPHEDEEKDSEEEDEEEDGEVEKRLQLLDKFLEKTSLARLLKLVAGWLAKYTTQNTDVPKLKQQYFEDLLRTVVYEMHVSGSYLALSDDDGPIEISDGQNYGGRDFDDIQRVVKRRIAVAAAAVGNTHAYETLSSYPYYRYDDGDKIFGSPLRMAALNGKVGFIQKHLAQQDSLRVPRIPCLNRVYDVAGEPLKAALSHNEIDAAKLLIDFIAKHWLSIELQSAAKQDHRYEQYNPVIMSNLIEEPMRQGSIEIFEHVH